MNENPIREPRQCILNKKAANSIRLNHLRRGYNAMLRGGADQAVHSDSDSDSDNDPDLDTPVPINFTDGTTTEVKVRGSCRDIEYIKEQLYTQKGEVYEIYEYGRKDKLKDKKKVDPETQGLQLFAMPLFPSEIFPNVKIQRFPATAKPRYFYEDRKPDLQHPLSDTVECSISLKSNDDIVVHNECFGTNIGSYKVVKVIADPYSSYSIEVVNTNPNPKHRVEIWRYYKDSPRPEWHRNFIDSLKQMNYKRDVEVRVEAEIEKK